MTDLIPGFELPANTAVFVCQQVASRQSAVLHVTHEADGDWQFLCGGDHGDGSGDLPKVWGLAEVLHLDPGLSALSELCIAHSASRKTASSGWVVHDLGEDSILKDVAKYGWHAVIISAGQKPEEPGFAYSIGLFKTWKLPELIVFGLPAKVAHSAMLCSLELMKRAGPLKDGATTEEVFDGAQAVFRSVAAHHYVDHLGYAMWFYKSQQFPVLQLFYPDSIGRFPWNPACEPNSVRAQPQLFK